MIINTTKQSERVYVRAPKSPIIFFWPFVFGLVSFYLCQLESILALLGVVCGLTAIIFFIRVFLIYFSSDIKLTDSRVIIKSGIFRKKYLSYSLIHISGVELDKNFLCSILDCSHVVFYVSGQRQVAVTNLRNTKELQKHTYILMKKVFAGLNRHPSLKVVQNMTESVSRNDEQLDATGS